MTLRDFIRLFRLGLQGSVCLSFLLSGVLKAQVNSNEAVNLVVQLEGRGSVKRQGWTGSAPLVFGTALRAGDLIDLGQSSHAKVVCSDLTLHDVPGGIGGVPCSPSRGVLRRENGSLINATRGWPSDGLMPVVVSPRKTKLLSSHPTLRWTPVTGATTYRVTVRSQNLYWQTIVSKATQVVYPDAAPRLEPGVDYKLIVEANDKSSSDYPGLGLGFSLLLSKDRKTVLEGQKQIEKLQLPEGPTQFLVAHLYTEYGLYAEAIERLEGISDKFGVAAVRRLLGDLYMNIGLARQAEADYLNSLELSKSENDDEGQMLDHKALEYIYQQILGNKEAAGEQLNATLDLAKKLGDDLTASQAGKQLAELKASAPNLN